MSKEKHQIMNAKEKLNAEIVRKTVDARIEKDFIELEIAESEQANFRSTLKEHFFNQIIRRYPELVNEFLNLDLTVYVITEFENEKSIFGKVVFRNTKKQLAEAYLPILKCKAEKENSQKVYVLHSKNLY